MNGILLPEDSFDDFSDDDQSLGVVDIGPDGDYNMHKICLGQWDTLSGGGSQKSIRLNCLQYARMVGQSK